MTDFIEITAKTILPIIAEQEIPKDYGIGDLTAILFWIARAVVIAVGGGVSLIMITKGKADENPKQMNEGYVILTSAGIIFAATFAVQAIF